MDEQKFADAIKFLRAFFSEMREWQLSCIQSDDSNFSKLFTDEGFLIKITEDLKVIFDKYIQYKEFNQGITYSDRPFYDPENMTILEVKEKKDKLEIVVDRPYIVPKCKLKFTLIKTEAGYKILDNLKAMNEYVDKFEEFDFLL